MRCLMAHNQREALIEALPEDGLILEWGSGGTTKWLLEHMSPSQQLMTVEHDGRWVRELRQAVGDDPRWSLRHCPPSGSIGTNATPWVECPVNLDEYLIPPVSMAEVDVFLIDGPARGACLMHVLMAGREGARVFLHDAQRPWYEWAKAIGRNAGRIIEETEIEADDGDYPPLMWTCTLG